MFKLTNQELFTALYNAPTEEKVDELIQAHPETFSDENWSPLGGDENMFGIVRSQQSNPIAALVEKITNSIDALLVKRCLELEIDPKGTDAPKSMEEALKLFYPNHKNWDLVSNRKLQAEEIQIIADGPPRNTSVIMYDNGEGQHPEDFENTFLSLVKGNKINIPFVQGKYNMGGSGALVFCGKKRYQLIASKRYDNTGEFGFTLIRLKKIGKNEENKRSSHFEYLKISGKIPSFQINELDLKLKNRKFKTGSIIKLYSYQFPPGYSGFAQELNQSLNEYLFEPVLPLFTVDNKERYPSNNVLDLDLFGLKKRLEENGNKYVEDSFTEIYTDESIFGKIKVTCYVFKPRLEGRDVKKSREIIRSRFFKNNMSVQFSINGQVHGDYSSEFISRTLKFHLLKDSLLIHVDCTHVHPDFREELFMASRDRLKNGDEATILRKYLGEKLKKSKLEEINRRRRESIGFESEDSNELIKSFAKNLPKDSDLFKLLQNTLKLDEPVKDKNKSLPKSTQKAEVPFHPKRFPTKFQFHNNKGQNEINAITLPINGEKTIKFDSDIDNDYFDRSEEPGELQLAILQVKRNNAEGGDEKGEGKSVGAVFNVVKRSPDKGMIKITLNPTNDLKVGDEVELKVSLTAPGEPLEEVVWVKISDKEVPKEQVPTPEESLDNIGLPELKKVKQSEWENLENNGVIMNHSVVVVPMGNGEILEQIYINLDSHVFLRYRSRQKNEIQITTAEKRYLSSVYFHTLFLYMITKKGDYNLSKGKDGDSGDISIEEYISQVFDSHYTEFLLNFGMEQLMGALED